MKEQVGEKANLKKNSRKWDKDGEKAYSKKWLLVHLEKELQGFNKKDIKKLMMALSVKSIKLKELKDKNRSELIKELALIIDCQAGQENIYRINLKIQLFRVIKDIELSKSDRKEVGSFIKVITMLNKINNLKEKVDYVWATVIS